MDQWSLTGGTLEMKTSNQQCTDSIRKIVLSLGRSSSRDFRAWTLWLSKNHTGSRTRWQGKDGSVPSKETERKQTTSGSPSLGSLNVENWGLMPPVQAIFWPLWPWHPSQVPGWNHNHQQGEMGPRVESCRLLDTLANYVWVVFYRPWSTYPTLSHLILTTSLWDKYY